MVLVERTNNVLEVSLAFLLVVFHLQVDVRVDQLAFLSDGVDLIFFAAHCETLNLVVTLLKSLVTAAWVLYQELYALSNLSKWSSIIAIIGPQQHKLVFHRDYKTVRNRMNCFNVRANNGRAKKVDLVLSVVVTD